MTVLSALIFFAFGIALIFKGGDFFVDAAGWLSDATGVSKAVIGATLVSFATTSPEYFVSTIAVYKGYNDLSTGNAVGSLIANIGLAFALLAILSPGRVRDSSFGIKGGLMLLATFLLWLFCLDGTVSAQEGIVLLGVFTISIFINIRLSGESGQSRRGKLGRKEIALNSAKFIGGAAGVVLGSNLVVDNAQFLALRFGIPEAVIGLTIVAVGTSLPEIVTSIAAIVKKQNAISIGNIIGANIIDATLILATGAFISGGLAVSTETTATDLPVAIAVMLIAVLPTAIGKKIYRAQGVLLVAVYAGYMAYITLLG